MKRALTVLALILSATTANAAPETVCRLNAENSKYDLVFDRTIFSATMTRPLILVVSQDLSTVREITISRETSFDMWKRIDGQSLVFLGAQANGQFAISLGKVDLSKRKNMLPIDAMVSGAISEGQDLSVVARQRHFNITCSQSK